MFILKIPVTFLSYSIRLYCLKAVFGQGSEKFILNISITHSGLITEMLIVRGRFGYREMGVVEYIRNFHIVPELTAIGGIG